MERPNCATCRAQVNPCEATLSKRALGAVLCHHCRDRQAGCLTVDGTHEEVFPLGGYGLWEARHRRDGQEFTGGGLSPHQALCNARQKAQECRA